jgi:hypothetical protein
MRKKIFLSVVFVFLSSLVFTSWPSQAQNKLTLTLVRFPLPDALSDQVSLLIKDVLKDFPNKVEYKVEFWGESQLAKKYGIEKYPIVFVQESIFATPEDLGFMMSRGKYAFWQTRENQKKFKEELKKYLAEF